jgi:WD40 repeat protein
MVSSVSWSPDGQRLATANDDETVKVWEVASGRELITFKGHSDALGQFPGLQVRDWTKSRRPRAGLPVGVSHPG